MANAGNHGDTKLLKFMIKEGRLLKVYEIDHPIAKRIKFRFNDLVINDQTSHYRYNGKNYNTHSAWNRMDVTLIWVNQLRLKHWWFEPLSL
jgi:hypothetical protein